MSKIKLTISLLFNSFILYMFSSSSVFASTQSDNDALANEIGPHIKHVLDAWLWIAVAAMVLTLIAGSFIMTTSGTDPRMREAGKSTIIAGGVSISLLLSVYVIVELILKIFGLSLFS